MLINISDTILMETASRHKHTQQDNREWIIRSTQTMLTIYQSLCQVVGQCINWCVLLINQHIIQQSKPENTIP